MQQRDRGTRQSLGLSLTNRIHSSHVLLVGAGGIGCEVLKNIVCCGFGSSKGPVRDGAPSPGIVVVDLDTIDLSNLNRQFLFRKHHIKQPKAFVAKETANQYNPSVQIDAQHASIFDSRYDVDFFKSFDVVFNALDNLAARRHVNRMCLAADIPLIESGTTGYNGQVQAIQKGITECYDCNPKPVQTSYAICTIRSTPSQPIHCIVWAKSYLLPELFGELNEEQNTDMKVTVDDSSEEVAKLQEEAEALKRIRNKMGQPDFTQALFDKVFGVDIERLASMTEMWKTSKPPKPLVFATLVPDLESSTAQGQKLCKQDQTVWTLEENVSVFLASLRALSLRTSSTGIEFDKDDHDVLAFVASAANIRAHIFGIALTSEWHVKQMAGNIIPAIATSNAMTASLSVMQAFKIMRMNLATEHSLSNGTAQAKKMALPLGGSRMTFLTSKSADRTIISEALRPPNPYCAVCSPTYAQLGLPKDSNSSLSELVDILKTDVGYDGFSISTDIGIIYDPDEDGNLERPLRDFGIGNGSNSFVTITDEADEARVDLVLSVHETGDKLGISPEGLSLPLKPRSASPTSNGQVMGSVRVTSGTKRKREEDKPDMTSKKVKSDSADQAIVVIDDDGAILLDDD